MADGTTIPRLSVYNINAATSSIVTNGVVTFSNTSPLRLSVINASNVVLAPGTSPMTVATTRAGTIIPANVGGMIFQSASDFLSITEEQIRLKPDLHLRKVKLHWGKTSFGAEHRMNLPLKFPR
ncbi:hypothetical protein EG351_20800 [Chryseobacterium bernardetii]|nr:hypothetical protein EG351_20800 [Chryseobacterium bernardetii]